jgi:hypothetical protein
VAYASLYYAAQGELGVFVYGPVGVFMLPILALVGALVGAPAGAVAGGTWRPSVTAQTAGRRVIAACRSAAIGTASGVVVVSLYVCTFCGAHPGQWQEDDVAILVKDYAVGAFVGVVAGLAAGFVELRHERGKEPVA